MDRRRFRWSALAGIALVAAAQLVVGAAPAVAAVGGLDLHTAATISSLAATKSVRVDCPERHKVLGGGGWIVADNGSADLHRIVLTELRPGEHASGDGYYQVGAEAIPGFGGRWSLKGYAICAYEGHWWRDQFPDYRIRSTTTTASSQSVKVANVGCPGGTRAFGSGASIVDGRGEVGLQVMRPSGSGDIVRTQARELAGGYAGNWRLTGYAVCAKPPAGYEVVFAASPARHSEQYKTAHAYCPFGKRTLSAGGAIIDWAPGGTALSVTRPTPPLNSVVTTAAETSPINQYWDLIVSTAVCAYP